MALGGSISGALDEAVGRTWTVEPDELRRVYDLIAIEAPCTRREFTNWLVDHQQ